MNLSPRLLKVVELVGGRGLPYKAAAKAMGGISPRTVEEYAAEIRARAGLSMNPRAAVRHVHLELRKAKRKSKSRAA